MVYLFYFDVFLICHSFKILVRIENLEEKETLYSLENFTKSYT